MAKHKCIEKEMIAFLDLWDARQMEQFLRDIIPLFEMFDVGDESDWMLEGGSEEDALNIKIVRAAYLVSRIAEKHAGRLCSLKIQHKNLWKRLEERANECDVGTFEESDEREEVVLQPTG